jgi:hypothetical protein
MRLIKTETLAPLAVRVGVSGERFGAGVYWCPVTGGNAERLVRRRIMKAMRLHALR